MGLIESAIAKYFVGGVARPKEIDLSEEREQLYADRQKMAKMLSNNHDYRLRLQRYRKRIRDDECRLAEKEQLLHEQEESMKERVTQTLLQQIIDERERIAVEIQSAKEELSALREAELQIIDWVTRMERKERAFLEDAFADVQKLQKSQIKIDGIEFEAYIAELLSRTGYDDVRVTQQSRDYGADVLAVKDGIKYVFQCKCYSSPVGIEAIQEVFSAKSFYKAHIAVAVTNNIFTSAAKILSDELGVILWDCEKLANLSEGKDGVSCQKERL